MGLQFIVSIYGDDWGMGFILGCTHICAILTSNVFDSEGCFQSEVDQPHLSRSLPKPWPAGSVFLQRFFFAKIVYERGVSSKPCLIQNGICQPQLSEGISHSIPGWLSGQSQKPSHPEKKPLDSSLQKWKKKIPGPMDDPIPIPGPHGPLRAPPGPLHLLVAAMIFTVVWLVKPSSWFSSSSIVLCTSRTPRGRSQVWNFQPLL